MYDQLTSEKDKEIIKSGWRAAGIIEAVEKGSENLQKLDPFQDLDPITFNIIPELPLKFPEAGHADAGHADANERYELDSDYEYDLDQDRNAFDAINDM